MSTYVFEGIIYTYSGSTASATGFNAGTIQSVSTIQSSITVNSVTYTVTSIGDNAFFNCSALNNVTIPSSVITIGTNAFRSCVNLTNATISNGEIGVTAFYLSGLTTLTILTGVTSIGMAAFQSCVNLTMLTIPSTVTYIGQGAFQSCTNLTTLTISPGVTSISNAAFFNCLGLTTLTIPSTVTFIGESAFQICRGLYQVTFVNPTIYTTCGPNCFTSISEFATGIFQNVNPADASGLGTNTPASTLPQYFATDIYEISCILKGTPILTSKGYVNIEDLNLNDTVITWDKRAVKIIGNHVREAMADTDELIPYKIPKGLLGALDDLYISKHHCILIDGEYFNVPHNMPQLVQSELHAGQSITYYHIETENYFTDTLVANGVPIETFTSLSFDQIKQQAEFIEVDGQSFRKISKQAHEQVHD